MAKYGTGKGDDKEKFNGFVQVGLPFSIAGGFKVPEGEWAQGRTTAMITGTIQKALPHATESYDGTEKFFAPEECVGHTVAFFPQHLLDNHFVGDGYDDYQFLNVRRSKKGNRPLWPGYWTEWLLSKAGASTKDLVPWADEDDDRLLKGIVALLNNGGSWPVAIWNSRGGDIERQVPPGTQLLAHFHQFLYWDWKAERPTWVTYQETTDKGTLRTVRDVTFLLRVVAPEPWIGTLLRMPVNYTMRHQEEDDEHLWWLHEMSNLGGVIETLGVDLADFVEDVDESLLYEVGVGEPANLLGPLEEVLREVADRRLLGIKIPDRWSVRYKNVKPADAMLIEKVTGEKAFAPGALRTINDLSEEQIETEVEEAESIPGFEDDDDEFPSDKVFAAAKEMAGFDVWKETGGGKAPLTEEGMKWAGKVLVPLFEIVGIERKTPTVGWTKEKVAQMKTLLADETFVSMCESFAGDTDKSAIAEYGKNFLATPVEEEEGGAQAI